MFVDAKNEVERKNAESKLTAKHIGKIVAAYRAFKNDAHFAHVASNGDIRAKDGNLAIQMYMTSESLTGQEKADLSTVVTAWENSSVETAAALQALSKLFGGALP